jgi:hypothetical protein
VIYCSFIIAAFRWFGLNTRVYEAVLIVLTLEIWLSFPLNLSAMTRDQGELVTVMLDRGFHLGQEQDNNCSSYKNKTPNNIMGHYSTSIWHLFPKKKDVVFSAECASVLGKTHTRVEKIQ